MYKLLVIIYCGMLLMACASAPYRGSTNAPVEMAGQRVDFDKTDQVKQILNRQYHDWSQVRHRMGGLSKDGIDCSGLVYNTFRSKFGIDVPRSTEYQSQLGQSIKQDQLRAGDMVFFKTGFKVRHVGMYIDNGNFLHASSSKGVMISNLENPYWSSVYWKAKRLQ